MTNKDLETIVKTYGAYNQFTGNYELSTCYWCEKTKRLNGWDNKELTHKEKKEIYDAFIQD